MLTVFIILFHIKLLLLLLYCNSEQGRIGRLSLFIFCVYFLIKIKYVRTVAAIYVKILDDSVGNVSRYQRDWCYFCMKQKDNDVECVSYLDFYDN